jgi:hypothetical protein
MVKAAYGSAFSLVTPLSVYTVAFSLPCHLFTGAHALQLGQHQLALGAEDYRWRVLLQEWPSL